MWPAFARTTGSTTTQINQRQHGRVSCVCTGLDKRSSQPSIQAPPTDAKQTIVYCSRDVSARKLDKNSRKEGSGERFHLELDRARSQIHCALSTRQKIIKNQATSSIFGENEATGPRGLVEHEGGVFCC